MFFLDRDLFSLVIVAPVNPNYAASGFGINFLSSYFRSLPRKGICYYYPGFIWQMRFCGDELMIINLEGCWGLDSIL